jgi:alpha-glucosidase
LLLKDPDFRDNPPHPNPPPYLAENDLHHRQLNIYNQDLDEVHEIIREFRALLEVYGDRTAIGEVWEELPRWIRYYGSQGDGLNLPFNFRLIRTEWTAHAVRQSVDELEAALPAFAWPNYVLGNHDVARLASRVGQGQARVAAMLLLTLRGSPTLYYGDELGLENGLITPDKLQDPQGIRMGLRFTRDIARTPMQWDNSPQAGFSTAEPWLPLSPDWGTRNVAVMSADPTSILNLYRRLLTLRKNTRALQGGSYRPVEGTDPDLFVYLREHPTGRFLVALNFASQPRRLEVPGEETGWIALSTHLDREGKTSLDGFVLRPDEGVIMALAA